jgi:hypothetical protein
VAATSWRKAASGRVPDWIDQVSIAHPMVLNRPKRSSSSRAKPDGEETAKPGGSRAGSNWIGER